MVINEAVFVVLMFSAVIFGMIFSMITTREYRKSLEREYEEKHDDLYNTVRRETRSEWSKGWDAAYAAVGKTQKSYYLWFREHGYDLNEIDEWLKDYLNGKEKGKKSNEQ